MQNSEPFSAIIAVFKTNKNHFLLKRVPGTGLEFFFESRVHEYSKIPSLIVMDMNIDFDNPTHMQWAMP